MLRQRHVVRLETRPANIEGKGEVAQRQLVINALRMRPDRIVVGEVRGEEALDMLQAMNTGHDGSLTTIHANSPRDALYRLDTMVAMANLNIPEKAIRQQVASAVNVVVQLTRLSDGTPPRHRDHRDHRHGAGRHHHAGHLPVRAHRRRRPEGRVEGRFRATGIRPKCAQQLAPGRLRHGRRSMFEHRLVVSVGGTPWSSPSSRSRCARRDPRRLLAVRRPAGERAGESRSSSA